MNLDEYDIEIEDLSSDDSEEDVEISEGADSDFVVEDDEPEQMVDECDVEIEDQPIEYGEWESPADFELFVVSSARKTPATYENSPNSLRRTLAYLEKISSDIISGVEQDASYAELSESQLRSLDLIEEGINKATADITAALNGKQRIKKVATKSSTFHTFINPFIHSLARLLINAKVSQGKNIEDMFQILNDRYKLDEKEKLQLFYALNDFGHPIRSSFVDHLDMADQYQA